MIEMPAQDATKKCAEVTAAGASLMNESCLVQRLGQIGSVVECGSYFAGLAVRPELDLVLMVRPEVSAKLLETVESTLEEALAPCEIQREVRAQNDADTAKYFVRATTKNAAWEVDGASWTVDVAVWNVVAWNQRNGPMRDLRLGDRLSADERELVLTAKLALIERGLRGRVTTRELCDATLDGRLRAIAELEILIAETEGG